MQTPIGPNSKNHDQIFLSILFRFCVYVRFVKYHHHALGNVSDIVALRRDEFDWLLKDLEELKFNASKLDQTGDNMISLQEMELKNFSLILTIFIV